MFQMMNNRNNMFQMFQTFARQMQSQDPKALLQQLISSGKVSQSQVDQAKKLAEQFKGLLH